MKSPLRDLADLIQRTAMEHPAYGQASSAVFNLVDHLSAMARNEEANREINELRSQEPVTMFQHCRVCNKLGIVIIPCDDPKCPKEFETLK